MAVGSNPQGAVILHLLTLADLQFNEPKVRDTVIQTVTAMAQRFSMQSTDKFKNAIVQKVTKYVSDALDVCTNTECKLIFIRGLHNLENPKTTQKLLEFVYNTDKEISVAAMKALRNFRTKVWSTDDRRAFENIFYQKTRRFDSSARTLALDILLELRPSTVELRALLEYLRSNDRAYEVKQYLLQNIKMISERCSRFRSTVQKILSENPTLNNYHIIGQRGL